MKDIKVIWKDKTHNDLEEMFYMLLKNEEGEN